MGKLSSSVHRHNNKLLNKQKKLCIAPVLVLPDLRHPFEINMDASHYSLDAVITHLGHPVVFHSVTFNDIVRRYLTYEKELHAIMQAIQKWRH